MFGKVGGSVVDVPRLKRALKIISNVLFWFNLRLLSDAHWLMLLHSGRCVLCRNDEICIVSVYLMISLPIVIGRRSPVLTTYAAGPRADPWITLANIFKKSESSPPNLVQWER